MKFYCEFGSGNYVNRVPCTVQCDRCKKISEERQDRTKKIMRYFERRRLLIEKKKIKTN